jgi:hypothetical protein
MTEAEAKKKRCCGPDGCGEKRNTQLGAEPHPMAPKQRYCIGSACMAWRDWGDKSHCGLAGEP